MTLEIYSVVLELVRRLGPGLPVLRARSAALADQFERALISVPLNVAEGPTAAVGIARLGQTAAASAREALACWETAHALGLGAPTRARCSRLSLCELRAFGWRCQEPAAFGWNLVAFGGSIGA